jgi:hypothetical protein
MSMFLGHDTAFMHPTRDTTFLEYVCYSRTITESMIIAMIWSRFKTRSVKADYKLAPNFTLQDAKFAVDLVQKLLQEIHKIQPM